ncbi:MAG: ACP S-malonyltransferase [Taibaiella sp.]|nr:ACP S-malonyltransferase [Taibaiella sp.]
MKHAYVFPGQGAQFPGMGKNLFEANEQAKELFQQADAALGFSISDIMFNGSDEELKQTKVTQPAVFLHSVIAFLATPGLKPEMVAGHSLGEFSALVASGALNFTDGLMLVYKRAMAMQKACEMNPSTMAAVLGMEDAKVEEIVAGISNEVVVAANYNCPGQLVISGSIKGVEQACEALKAAGAKRALVLPVGGAFHSPLMQPAQEELREAIELTTFNTAQCPVYQNVDAKPYTDPAQIRQNLINQLTAPVRWTQTVQNMIADGANHFTEVGPGNVLQGLVKKINKEMQTDSIN